MISLHHELVKDENLIFLQTTVTHNHPVAAIKKTPLLKRTQMNEPVFIWSRAGRVPELARLAEMISSRVYMRIFQPG